MLLPLCSGLNAYFIFIITSLKKNLKTFDSNLQVSECNFELYLAGSPQTWHEKWSSTIVQGTIFKCKGILTLLSYILLNLYIYLLKL